MFNLRQTRSNLYHALWDTDLTTVSRARAMLIRALRLGYAVIRDLADGQITLRAMSLVYTTLLSLVPLLAVSFSVLKAFGVHNQIEPALLRILAPLGAKAPEVTERIIGFVENVKAGILGSVGLAFLIYTVIALIQKIERAFNYTWHVSHQRPFSQRFSDYLAVILVGPVLVFVAMGLTASIMSATLVQKLIAIDPFGELIHSAGRLIPYLLVIGAFVFIYMFVPNTKVRFRSAFVGAVIAGIAWETVGWLFASFVAGSIKYTAIYSAFATLILFMIWIYLSWLILLLGANIAFYHQHPERVTPERQELVLSARMREKLALLIMALVTRRYYHNEPAWAVEALGRHLHSPIEPVEQTVATLVNGGLLVRTRDEPPGYVPGHAPEAMTVDEVLEAVRSAGEGSHLHPAQLAPMAEVDKLFRHLEEARQDVAREVTIKELSTLSADPARDARSAISSLP